MLRDYYYYCYGVGWEQMLYNSPREQQDPLALQCLRSRRGLSPKATSCNVDVAAFPYSSSCDATARDATTRQRSVQGSACASYMEDDGHMQRPLVPIPAGDVEASPSGACVLECACRGRLSGVLRSYANGDFVYDPSPTRPKRWLDWLLHGWRRPKRLVIPACQLLGARMEGRGTLAVWYSTSHTVKHCSSTKTSYKLRHTDRFEVADTEAAKRFMAALRQQSWGGRSRSPCILVILNPHSGKGAGRLAVERTVVPVLQDVAGMRVVVQQTEGRMHAAELVQAMDVQGTDVVVFAGGDGTLYEGLQGLFRRPDWDAARSVPIALMPTGSGNGMAASAGVWDPETAVVTICKGRVHPLDIASVLQPPGSRNFCALSIVHGIMANLDIGTEHLRWLGSIRFALGGLYETLFKPRGYACRAFVLPAEASSGSAAALTPTPSLAADGLAHGPGGSASSHADNGNPLSRTSSQLEQRPELLGPDGGNGSSSVRMGGGAAGTGAAFGAGAAAVTAAPAASGASPAASGRCEDYPAGRRSPPAMTALLSKAEDSQHCFGPALPILSSLGRLPASLPDSAGSLPAGWQMLQAANPSMFSCNGPPYVSLDARMIATGRLCSGSWTLSYMEHQAGWLRSRVRGLRFLLGVDDGSYFKLPFVHNMQIKALLFEPRGRGTYTVVDGEQAPDRPLYMEVHPGLANILVSPGFSEQH